MFNQWTEVEECAWVRDALEGGAADVLWELGTDATSTDILETFRECKSCRGVSYIAVNLAKSTRGKHLYTLHD